MMKALTLFTVVVLCCSVIRMNEDRLPKSVIPYFYNITTDIYPDMFYFKGITEIYVDVVEETNNITLHSLELTIKNVSVFFNGRSIKIDGTDYVEEFQFLIINLNRNLIIGKYKILIEYEASLSNNLRGLFASNYTPIDGYPRNLAFTHFEPMDARKAFPCFDEPEFKANFSISVITRIEYIALSNMELKRTFEVNQDRVLDVFETTPKMSTYFVAFGVCDYSSVNYERGHIYMRPTHIERANFVISVLAKIIDSAEEYVGMKLPVDKLDIVAVRQMSGADGMENWGLIVLMEDHGFFKEGLNTRQQKQDAFALIIHEVVHQWFGDLVTCDWWNDLWLNEGLTTHLQAKIGAKLMPDWKVTEQAVFYWLRTGVEIDYLENARSLSQKADRAKDYEKYFDYIAYTKAAIIFYTLENIVGEEIFRKTLHFYLQKHQYSTVIGKDLWEAFEENIDETSSTKILPKSSNITAVMETWEKQAGLPMLIVTRKYSDQTVHFSQKRYLLKNTKNFTTEWYIPINIATKSNPDFKNISPQAWLEPNKPLTWDNKIKSDDWLIVNKEASFYYLVNYDEKNWKLIANALNTDNFGKIPPMTRAKLIYDAFMLAISSELKFSVALQLIKYLRKETDYVVLEIFFYVFDFFYKKFSTLEDFHHLEKFLADALQPSMEKLGIEENKNLTNDMQHVEILNRLHIIKWACTFGNRLCRNLTMERIKTDINTILIDLKEVIVCGGLIEAETSLWYKIFQKTMEEANFYSNKALGCSENEESLDIYVDDSLQYRYSIFYRLYQRSPFGANYTLYYLVKHFERLNETLSQLDMTNIINGLADRLTTKQQLDMLKSIKINLTSTPQMDAAYSKAVAKIDTTVKWVKAHSDDITKWIREELLGDGFRTARVSLVVVCIVLLADFVMIF